MYKKILLQFLFCFGFLFAQGNNFIISKKNNTRVSKNELKEDIGIGLKDVLNSCSSLNKQAGKVQICVSKLQKNLFKKVEDLIDNKKPFKRSNKDKLRNAIVLLNKITMTFKREVVALKNIQKAVGQDKILKKT